jgi:eukaryotic-like serine/threonine-protein kinase
MSGQLSDVGQPPQRGGTFRPSDVSQMAICSGASFGIYVLRELIGVGNTSSVYRAHDTRLLRQVALKVLNTEVLAGADGLARFLHEARMAAAIRHPNVVSMFDVGAHDGKPYIVMELLTGEDLDARLNAVRVLREPALIDMAVQLASGLGAVHDAGVVHRDVRPGNVFLARGPDGSTEPKLLDFGGSKQTRDNGRLTTNGRRRWAAMPLYTAPEVLLEGEASFLSDQYSLGVLLYECATGVHPFRADTVRDSVELISAGHARRIAEQPLQPSRRLAAIIERAMHFDPAERFADMRELASALASVRERRALWPWRSSPGPAIGRTAASAMGAKARQAPLKAPEGSGRGLSWAIGATVIACSIGAPVWAWWSVRRPRAPAAISVTAPLTSSAAALPGAAPPESGCAPLAPTPAGGQSSPPAVATAAPDPSSDRAAPVMADSHPPPTSDPSVPARLAPPAESAAAPAGEPAAPSPVAQFAESGAVGDDGQGEPAAPSERVAPLPEGEGVDPGLAPSDAGVVDPQDTLDVTLPRLAAPTIGPERGTNGALIFD